jgi:glyoxylase I family protein
MENLVKGIHHVGIRCVGDEEFHKSIDFYSKVLGLPVAKAWTDSEKSAVMLDTGSGYIELFNNGDKHLEQGVIRHVALLTDNTDKCIEAVRKAGYKVTIEPKISTLACETPYPIKFAFFIGPMGEEVELFQEIKSC